MFLEPSERGIYKNFSHLGLLTEEDISAFYISENTYINTNNGGHTTCNWKCKLQCNLTLGLLPHHQKPLLVPQRDNKQANKIWVWLQV